MPQQTFYTLRRIISGSLCMIYGINEAIFHVLQDTKFLHFGHLIASYDIRLTHFEFYPSCST